MDGQLRRYFLGLLSFGTVAVWASAGLVTAVLALLACVGTVHGSRLLSERGRERRHRGGRRQTPVGTRRLRDDVESPPLVPDDPSLIIELG